MAFLIGTPGADALFDTAGDDTVLGGYGNGTLTAAAIGGGFDRLYGGDGVDTLGGGDGPDTLRFDGPAAGSDDTVTDFASGVHAVALSASGFHLSSLSTLAIVSAASGALEAKATLIVDEAAHTLSLDANGTGAGAAVWLAAGAFTTAATDYVLL